MKSLLNVLVFATLIMLASCDPAKKTADAIDTGEEVMEAIVDLSQFAINPDNTPGRIGWTAENERYSADGGFESWNFANISMDGGIESLDADLVIDLASVSEKTEKLAEHLRQWDYFDVAKYTTATANISNVRQSGDSYIADLTLRMRGAEQVIESAFEVQSMNPLRVKGSADVDRRIFKIGSDETGKYTGFDGAGDIITVTYDTEVRL